MNLELAQLLPPEEAREMLLAFASGPVGPRNQRLEAYSFLVRNKLISKHNQKFWANGQETETELMGLSVTFESSEPLKTPGVQRLMKRAFDAQEIGDLKTARTHLEQAIALDPESPTLRNNLAATYLTEGQMDMYEQIVEQLYRDHPDYFFACTNMANIYRQRGEFDAAQALLDPLKEMEELHISQFRALATVQLAIDVNRDELEKTELWLGFWANLEPDFEVYRSWREKVDLLKNIKQGMDAFSTLMKRPRRTRTPKLKSSDSGQQKMEG